ncbi:MAG: hypothetical protein IMY71_06575 [Bacteroidetes bacterium]|nr:hypothetical protein [Bacteroidota bacterium]
MKIRKLLLSVIIVLLAIGGAISCKRHTSKKLQEKEESQIIYRICDSCQDVFAGEDPTCPECGQEQCPEVLEEMNRLLTGLWDYAESMRVQDRPYGYFRWSRSAYDEYSTMASYMALNGYNLLSRLGYPPPLSQNQLEEWRETAESWYNPETGLIEDSLPLKRLGISGSEYESIFLLYTQRWLTILRTAGVPGDFVVPKNLIQKYDVFADVDQARAWLDSMKNVPNPWGWGSHAARNLSRHQKILADQGREDGVLDFVHQWIDENQNPETGLWGPPETPLHDAVAGHFKIVKGMYLIYGWPIHYIERTIDSALRLQDSTGSFGPGPCENFDALYSLYVLKRETDYRSDDIDRAAALNALEVLRYWHEDESGFSFNRDSALLTVGGWPQLMPEGINEADIYSMAHWPMAVVYMRAILLGEDPEPKPDAR